MAAAPYLVPRHGLGVAIVEILSVRSRFVRRCRKKHEKPTICMHLVITTGGVWATAADKVLSACRQLKRIQSVLVEIGLSFKHQT